MERGMEMFTALVGSVLVLVGLGAMACYTMVFFFPALHGLVVGGDRLPRARALLGVLVGFLVFSVGILFTGVAFLPEENEILPTFGGLLMIAGMGLSLYFAAAFLFPAVLRRVLPGTNERPRGHALPGLLGGLLMSGGGAVLSSSFETSRNLGFMDVVGLAIGLTGILTMACFAIAFLLPSFLDKLRIPRGNWPRARALLGILAGCTVSGCAVLIIEAGEDPMNALAGLGVMMQFLGVGISLYYGTAFLFPSLLGRNRAGAERPRRYALLGLLVGLAGSACGGFLWSAARVTYRLYQWHVPVVIIGLIGILTMACFAIAFFFPSVLDKLRIPRGNWPRGRALLGVLAGLVMYCGVTIMMQAVRVAEAERMDELNAAIQERIDGIAGMENRSEPYIRPGSGEGAIHTLRVDYTLVNKTSDEAVQAVTVHSVVTNPEGMVIYEGNNPFDITAQGGPLEAGRSGSASWELQANAPDAPLEKEIMRTGGKNIQVHINFSSVTTDKGTTALLTE